MTSRSFPCDYDGVVCVRCKQEVAIGRHDPFLPASLQGQGARDLSHSSAGTVRKGRGGKAGG